MAAPLVALIPLATRALGTGANIASKFIKGGSGRSRLIRLTNNMDKRLKQIQKFAEVLPDNAHKHFRKTTPIDSGNARKSTQLENTTISANYNYANRLNEGYSRQARRGMTKPTIAYIRRELRKLR